MADELVIEFKVNEKDSLNKTTKILDAIKGLDIAIKLTTKSFSFLWDTAAGSVNTTLSTLSTGYQQLQKTMDSGALAASTLIDSLDKSRENAEALKKAGTELAVLKAIFLGMAGALAIALSVPVSSTVGVAIGISFLVNAFWELGKAIFDATEKQKQWAKEVDEATRLAHRRLEEFWKYAGVWGEGPGLFPESEQVIRPLEETLEIMRKIEDGNFGEYLAVQWSKYTEAIKFSNERLIDHRDLLKVTRMLEGHAPEKEKGGGFSIPSPNPFDEGQRSSVRLIPPGGNRSGNAAAIDNSVLDTQLAKIQALKELNDIYAVSLDMVFNKNELVYMSFKQGNPILSTVEQRQRDLVASNESLSQSEEEVLLTVPKATQAFDIHKATMEALEKQTEEHNKHIEELGKKYGVFSEKHIKEANIQITDLLEVWDKNKDKILANSDGSQKLLSDLTELQKIIGKGVRPELDQAIKVLSENSKKTAELTEKEKKLAEALGLSKKQFEKLSEAARKKAEATNEKFTELEKMLKTVGQAIIDIGQGLEDFGLISEEANKRIKLVGEGIMGAGTGLKNFAVGLVTKNPFKILEGGAKILTSIGKLFAGLFGDKWERRAKKALQGLAGVTDDMVEKLKKAAKELKSTEKAMNQLMAEFISEAKLYSEADFSGWANKVVGMMDQLKGKWGTSGSELTGQIGESFEELKEKADKLGLHGSKSMLMLIDKARELKAQGKEIPEVFEYVKEKLSEGATAIETYLSTFADTGAIQEQIAALSAELAAGTLSAEEAAAKQEELVQKQLELAQATEDVTANWDFIQAATLSTFTALQESGMSFIEVVRQMGGGLADLARMATDNGLEITGGLQKMTDLAAFIEQNEQLSKRIEATNQIMVALGDTAFLTQEDFTNFATNALSQFDQLIAAGATEEQALMLLGPQLDNLIKYHKNYGYAIDEQTTALIKRAREEGALTNKSLTEGERQIQLQGRMVDILERIAEKFGVRIPRAMEDMALGAERSFGRMQTQTGKWDSDLANVEQRLRKNIPDAVAQLDRDYTDAMSGHSIVTETGKWKYSLDEVNEILGRDLIDTAEALDKQYAHVMGDINDYLENTSKEGYKARLSFDEMVDELVVLKDAYDNLASKGDLSEFESNILADYKRQIEELSDAIEESAPTLDNYRERFKSLKSELTGDIGVNTEMIGIARGLRSQGFSTEEIDRQIESSLTGGARGLADWVITAEDQEEFEQSQAMILSYFSALQSEGKTLTEIMQIMGDSFDAVAGKTITDEMEESGFQLSDTFSQLYELQQKMAENDDLITGIEGLSTALHGMGDSMLYMTEETFANFETASVSAFEKLKAAGFDQKQSLQLLAPLLKDLESYSAEYGYSLDETTAKLLEEAKESGLIKEEQKTDTEKLIDVNTQLANVMQSMVDTFTDMGEASPFAQMEEHAKKLQGEIRNMQKELEKLYAQKKQYTDEKIEGYVSAALGFHGVLPKDTWFRLHKGEQVDVWTPEETRKIQATPIRPRNLPDTRRSARDGDIVFEHITIQSENGEEAVKEFMTAIKGNKYGVQNLIRKVAH